MLAEEHLELDFLEREMCKNSLMHFSRQAWSIIEPGRFVEGWHIEAICDHLQAVINGDIRNLLINMPPRHMKSILVSVLFPAWAWIKKPELRWLFASYASSLSIRDSVKCRRIITSPWYQENFGDIYQLRDDQNQKQKYENNRTGHRIATSVDGTGTGEGGDIVVSDDPHKVGEAESKAVRENVLEWWDGEMSSRGNDARTVSKIIVMQRVHENDLSGHVLQQGGYEHLCLPAEFEPKRKFHTSIGWEDPRTEEGELLWPERFGPKEIATAKREMGSRKSAGQLQQNPAPQEGNIFKRHWWKFYSVLPEEVQQFYISVDLSFDDGEKASYSVFQMWGSWGANRYLIDQLRGQMSFPVQLSTFHSFVAKWPLATTRYVEKKANGAALLSTVQNAISGCIAVEPRGSKIARAESVTPQIESGNVYLPTPDTASWVEDFIEETAVFPNGTHDDQVDTMSQLLSKLQSAVPDDIELPIPTQKSKWLGRHR